jgi:hypothetical protein
MGIKRSDRLSPSLVATLCMVLIATLPALVGAAPATTAGADATHGAATSATSGTGGGGGATTAPAPPATNGADAATCQLPSLTVTDAYLDEKTSERTLQLGDVLTVKVSGLAEFQKQLDKPACKGKRLVLYLGGRPIPELDTHITSAPPTSESSERILHFTLKSTDSSRAAWADLLGSPAQSTLSTTVSVGLPDGYAFFSSAPKIELVVLPPGRFLWWALIYGAMLISFFVLAAKSDVLRDVGPPPGGGARRPFSLARTQAAWWFFIVLGSYLFIGLVTRNVVSSITGSVLVLVGISAGTVVGAAAVDASQQTPENKARQVNAQAQLTQQLAQADASLQTVMSADSTQAGRIAQAAKVVQLAQDASKDSPAMAQAADAARTAHSVETAKAIETTAAVTAAKVVVEEKRSQLKAARKQTENFLIDILSDADGVDFHRFQNAAWTLVLGIIFVCQVYRELAMPQFDGSLLALMGISAGTYLGMKIPEPKVPTVTPGP